ncbi:MAG: hypothetical protein JNK91_04290 [Ferruginibacter sp.]|nr:hypothetical protein [Ferruginibacter sp.]
MKRFFQALCLFLYATAHAQTNSQVSVKTIDQLRTLSPTDTTTLYYLFQKGKEGLWRYDPSDGSSADNTGTILVTASGKRLKRIISDGILYVNWFKVFADGKNDDKPGIVEALSFYKKNTSLIAWMQFGGSSSELITYRLNDTLRIDFNADIRGGASTRLLFTNNKAGLKLRSSETSVFIPTIYLSGLKIHQAYSTETFNSHETGVEINCIAHLKDISIRNFQGHGVLIWGDASTIPPTNADLSTFDRVNVTECRGNGFVIYGIDANIISFKDCQAIACGGAGWLDNSFLGNNYLNCQAASCSSPELAWNRGICKYGGKVYYALRNGTNKGAQTKLGRPDISPKDWALVPDQNWMQFQNIKAWSADNFYLAAGGFLLDLDNNGKNQRGLLMNCYTEMDCPPSYLGYACMKVGGNISSIREGLSMAGWFGLLDINTGIKVSNPVTSQTTMQRNNAFAWIKRIGELNGAVNVYDTINNFLSWYDWRSYDPNTNFHAYGGNFILPTQNTPPAYFGRIALGSNAYFTPFAQEIYLNDKTSSGNHHKKISMAEKAPVVNASDMTGDIVLNAVTKAGNDVLGWRKVGDGATGFWEPMVLAGSGGTVSSIDINGNKLRIRNSKTPASSNDQGNPGEICWDDKYFYICVANNKWMRSALTSW